ncbi:unnamed protein product [Rangifer tarandus platyrhynchus]|uniref:Uncharacterized protein n=1 Tax=Rangifer tarandus platyrhynchus TaxID=3082113 RepID=A0AC59YHS3_RANTA
MEVSMEDSEDDLVDDGELLKALEEEQGGVRWIEGATSIQTSRIATLDGSRVPSCSPVLYIQPADSYYTGTSDVVTLLFETFC